MKIISILGSPKKKGNTSKVLDSLEQTLNADGHEIKRINITEREINGCLGCMACMRSLDKPGCVQKDETLKLFDEMIEADAIVYASPVFGWDFTSQLKAFLDRHLCLVKGAHTPSQKSFLQDKTTAFVFTCMGPNGMPNTDLITSMSDRLSNYLMTNSIGTFVVEKSMEPDFEERAIDTGKKIAAQLTCV